MDEKRQRPPRCPNCSGRTQMGQGGQFRYCPLCHWSSKPKDLPVKRPMENIH